MIHVTHSPVMMSTQRQGISELLGKDLKSVLRKMWSFDLDIVLLTKTISRAVKCREAVPSFCEWIWLPCSEPHILNICEEIYLPVGLA